MGLPGWESEYAFHPIRKWRFDLALPGRKIAMEVEGGVKGGKGKACPVCRQKQTWGHRSVKGVLRDIEKYNEAQRIGWRVFRFLPEDVDSGKAFAYLKGVLEDGSV